MTTKRPPARSRARALYGAGTAVALTVTVVFATVGDGVAVAEATGIRWIIVEFGHTLVWVLLTTAFAIATVRGRWGRLSNGIAVAGGAAYLAFLIAVFVWR